MGRWLNGSGRRKAGKNMEEWGCLGSAGEHINRHNHFDNWLHIIWSSGSQPGLILSPRGPCGHIWRHSGFFGVEGDAAGISGAEATDATIHPPLHRTVPTTKNYSSPSANDAEVEKRWSCLGKAYRLRRSRCSPRTTSLIRHSNTFLINIKEGTCTKD